MCRHFTIPGVLVVLALVAAGCGGGAGLAYQNEGDGGEINLTMTAPAEDAWINQGSLQTISANASADGGVDRAEFFVDDVCIATDSSVPYSTTWNTAGYATGSHTITVTAYDQGTPASSASQFVTVYIWSNTGGGPPPPPIM